MATKYNKKKNWYVHNKFDKLDWEASLQKVTIQDTPIVSFKAGFYQAAEDLLKAKNNVKKQFKIVNDEINSIKKDEKTGSILKDMLVREQSAYQACVKQFYKDVNKLYNEAIDQFNYWMDYVVTSANSATATQGAQKESVQSSNASAGDEMDV